jgi:hypothetical protein
VVFSLAFTFPLLMRFDWSTAQSEFGAPEKGS